MQVSYTKLVDFINGEKIFTIPVFQRNYSWGTENCAQLFADIERIAEKGKPHFLGTVVHQKNNPNNDFDEYIIIDGQQRITSVILLAKAIFDSTDDEKIRDKIRAGFIENGIDSADYAFKLKLSEYDREIFEKLLTGKTLDASAQSSQLSKSYDFFKGRIASSSFKENLSELRSAISKLYIVSMTLDSENAQEIFESLNSTGLDLTETEKIRNFLLMELPPETQDRLYKSYWLPSELIFREPKKFERFMVYYLIARRKSITDMQGDKNIHISKNELYYTFKRYFEDNYGDGESKPRGAEDFLSDMYRYARFYEHFLFDETTVPENLSALDKKFYELVYLLGASSSPIMLLYLYDKFDRKIFDEATFIEFADALISMMFRAKVCRQTGIDSAQTAGNILLRLEKSGTLSLDNFWKVMTSGKGKFAFPSDEDFRAALTSNEIYSTSKNLCKYFLYTIEKIRATALPNYDSIAVECVMPRSLNSVWKKYLADKKDSSNAEIWVNAIGNLTLTVDAKNKNAAFNDKRVAYAGSIFSYTKDLAKNSDWTTNQISARTKTLANLAPKIWILPEKYQPVVTANKNTFTLEDDFSQFTNTSPAKVSISGKEHKITSWIGFLRTVAKELYTLDSETFRRAVQASGRANLFSASKENLIAPFQIDENYYVGSGLDTRSCLRIISALVENFDKLSGNTNFREEIWFKLSETQS